MKTSRITNTTSLKGALIALLVCTLILLSACVPSNKSDSGDSGRGNDTVAEQSYSFTDDLGNEVSISHPERVVACMGSFADIWQLSGGELIGVTDDSFDGYIEPSEDLAHVGDFTAPNLEEIVALSPDFVILTGSATGKDGAANQVDMRESLEASGITTAYFKVTAFDDYLRMLGICCNINGRADLYESNGAAVKERIDAIVVEAQKSEGEKPSVLLMTTYSGGTRVQNSSTMTGAMLGELGAVNLADENTSLLKDFSLESVIEMNPDYIFVVPMGNDDEAAMKNLEEATAANPAWATLDAVKKGRYITLEKEYFLYKPNEKWDMSYQILADALYGE